MTRRIFVRGTGQEDNIGDIVLRRAMFDRLRQAGELHIFLADASTDFIQALRLDGTETIYRDMRAWKKATLRSVFRRSTWFVDKPGEILLTEDIYKGQRSLLPILLAVRARGGRVLRLGVGQRSPDPVLTPRFRRLYRLANSVLWRDSESARAFGIGAVMPDWGFEPGTPTTEPASRDLLVASYRGDRPPLGENALAALTAFARHSELEIVVVTQVGRDDERTRELADALNASTLEWADSVSHADQESRLRDLFRRAAVVVSDRLHVLIVAATEGAIPVNLVAQPDIKVVRHFDVIGYDSFSIVTDGAETSELVSKLHAQSARRDELDVAVARARREIVSLTADALSLTPRAPARVG